MVERMREITQKRHIQAAGELSERDSKKLFLRNFPPGRWVGRIVGDVYHAHNVLEARSVRERQSLSDRMKERTEREWEHEQFLPRCNAENTETPSKQQNKRRNASLAHTCSDRVVEAKRRANNARSALATW